MNNTDNPFSDAVAIAAQQLAGQITPAFDVDDDPRTAENEEYHRTVFDWFGFLEPHLSAEDDWRSVPLRLTHSCASGWAVEVGRYTFGAADIALLRKAIAAYDLAVTPHDLDATEGGGR